MLIIGNYQNSRKQNHQMELKKAKCKVPAPKILRNHDQMLLQNTLSRASLRTVLCFDPKPAANNTRRSISVHVKGFSDLLQNSKTDS